MTHESLDAPVVVCMADVEAVPIRWLWPDRLPRGRLSLLAGMPGLGKSFATADFAARVSTGTPWPDGTPCERGSVLFVAAEDDPADTVRPRLDAHGADASRIHMLRGVHRLDRQGRLVEAAFMLDDLSPLERTLDNLDDVRLVIVDPIGSYMGSRVDAHRDTEVRGALAPLMKLAEDKDVAVLMVAHVRKGTAAHADDLVLGSRAFTALSRSVLHLFADDENEGQRLLVPGKNNLSAPPDGLAFTIEDDPPRVNWSKDPVTRTAAELIAAREGNSDGGALEEACDWLRDELCGGPVPTAELRKRAKSDGVAWRTVERAKAKIKADAERIDYDDRKPWAWSLGTT